MNTNRQISILALANLFIFLTFFWLGSASAETLSTSTDFNDYKGLWLTEVKGEAIYLLVKKNNTVRYFYRDSSDNNVYSGQWKLSEKDTLLVSSFEFEDLRFQKDNNNSNLTQSLNQENNTYILKKVPQEILGQWARPPDYQAPKNKYIPSTYFGLWEVQNQKKQRKIKIWNNRYVLSTSIEEPTDSPEHLLQGEWYKHGQQLHISWENGSYSIIDNRNQSKVKIFDFAPGMVIDEEKTSHRLIKQIQSELGDNNWEKNQQTIVKNKNINLSELDFKSLVKFYRGEWVTLDETKPNAVEIIKFNRFGGVDLASDTKTKGNWYLSGKGCLINLEGGIRMRLKYIGSAFLIFVYEANRPLDGFPNKILKTAPLNPKKLHALNADLYFTFKLLEQVDHLDIRRGKPTQLVSNWSNNNKINSTPITPWWWPIWNDNPKIKEADTFSSNNLSPSLTNQTDSIASFTEAEQTKLPNPTDEINKTKWEWPF